VNLGRRSVRVQVRCRGSGGIEIARRCGHPPLKPSCDTCPPRRRPTGQARTLLSIGITEAHLGRHGPALDHLQRALALFRQLGDNTGEAWTLNTLGHVQTRLGQYGPASDHLQQARAHTGLGHAYHGLGNPDRARQHHLQAVALHTDLGMPEADEIRATPAAD
jgi:tetratricopeptide (TPR) repeat protein